MDGWRDDVLTGKTTTFYRVADSGPLARIKIGPKLTTLIGGAPGAGKTAFVMQGVVDALGLNDSLRAVICNIEMPAELLHGLAAATERPNAGCRHADAG